MKELDSSSRELIGLDRDAMKIDSIDSSSNRCEKYPSATPAGDDVTFTVGSLRPGEIDRKRRNKHGWDAVKHAPVLAPPFDDERNAIAG